MSFEMKKDFLKLMNNSFYSKTVTKKINVRLINNAKKYKSYKKTFLG